MPTLKELRDKYPMYNDLSDEKFIQGFHQKFYSDMPIEDLYSKIGYKPVSVNLEKTEAKQNPFISALESLGRYGAIDPAIALTEEAGEFGRGIINSAKAAAPMFGFNSQTNMQKPDYGQVYGLPETQRNMADTLVQGGTKIGSSFLLPEARLGEFGAFLERIPTAGKYIKTGLANAIPQGLFSASQSEDDKLQSGIESGAFTAPFAMLARAASQGSPITRAASKGALALGAGGLGYTGAKSLGQNDLLSSGAGLLAFIGSLKGKDLLPNAKKDLLSSVEGKEIQPSLEAAKRLGLKYITPAEASGDPYSGMLQGSLGKTPEGSKLYLKKGIERLATEKQAINKLKSDIFNPELLSEKKNEFYNLANPKVVEETKIAPFQDNEVFKKALETVDKNAAYRESMKGVPENSIEHLDLVKRAMGDMIEGAPKDEARLIKKTQKKLMGVMDETAPEYKLGRALAEREIARNKVEDFFDKRKETGSNFAQFLKSQKNYNMLQHNLRNVPEAQQQLKDMKLLFEKLINVPTGKTAAAQSSLSMSKARSSTQDYKTMAKELLTGGKYDKTSIELMTNPRWSEELDKLNKVSDREKLASKFIELLGKAGAQSLNTFQNK